MEKLKVRAAMFIFAIVLSLGINTSSEGKSIAIEIHRADSSIVKSVLIQKDNKIRLDETLPNSDEIGNVIISDGKECWHIPAIGKPQKYPPIKNALELIGINKEAIEKESSGKIDNKVRKIASKKEMIQYKEFVETEDFGTLPGIIETYDSARVLQSRSIIKDTDNNREPSDDLFNYRKVTFSAKAKEIAKKMHFE